MPKGKEATDNPLPSGTKLLTVGKLFTFNKKLIIKLKFQALLYYLQSSILESFYSATSPALSGEKRYWLQRQHPAICIVVFLLLLKVNIVDSVCGSPGGLLTVLSTLDQYLIKWCHEYEYQDLTRLTIFLKYQIRVLVPTQHRFNGNSMFPKLSLT